MHDQKRASKNEVVDEATRRQRQAAFEATGQLYTSQFAKRTAKVYTKASLEENTLLLTDVPEGYVMFNYRREILLFLIAHAGDDGDSASEKRSLIRQARLSMLKDELRFNTTLLLKDFKNYFAFVHRHWIFEQLFDQAEEEVHEAQQLADSDDTDAGTGSPSTALAMIGHVLEAERRQCERLLDLDERNFHAWNHRRWVQQTQRRADALLCAAASEPVPGDAFFTAGERREIDYTTSRIKRNFSNYSAWHQRCLVLRAALRRHGIREGGSSRDTVTPTLPDVVWYALWTFLQTDVDMLIQAIYCDPNDQSAWFYAPFILDVYRTHAQSFTDAVASSGDLLDRFVESVVTLLVEEARLGEVGDCALPFVSLFDLLVRLTPRAKEDSDTQARVTRYAGWIASSLVDKSEPLASATGEAQERGVLRWLRDQLVRADAARTGMYDHLLHKGCD